MAAAARVGRRLVGATWPSPRPAARSGSGRSTGASTSSSPRRGRGRSASTPTTTILPPRAEPGGSRLVARLHRLGYGETAGRARRAGRIPGRRASADRRSTASVRRISTASRGARRTASRSAGAASSGQIGGLPTDARWTRWRSSPSSRHLLRRSARRAQALTLDDFPRHRGLGRARRRGRALREPSRGRPARAAARGLGEPARRRGPPGRQHDHPAARQEPVPVAPAHLRAQGERGAARAHPRGAHDEGADPRGLPEHGLPRPVRFDRHLRRAQGARAFFDKEPRDLTIAEAATIAGLIHAPNLDSPLRHPDRARSAATRCSRSWPRTRGSARDELAAAPRRRCACASRSNQPLEAPFFVDEVLRRVARMGYDTSVVRGLSVYTTLDLEAAARRRARAVGGPRQARAERTRRSTPRGRARSKGAIVALEAATGYVRAWSAGATSRRSQFNRVTRAQRQPGSAFKPFVYLAALDEPDDVITPATDRSGRAIHIAAGSVMEPARTTTAGTSARSRCGRRSRTRATCPRSALARPRGLDGSAPRGERGGLGDMPRVPAIALGSARGLADRPGGGVHRVPDLGRWLRPGADPRRGGERRHRCSTATGSVASGSPRHAASYVTSHLLEGVVEEGTGASACGRLGITRAVAGKTGTTNDAKDAWFVGYSPGLIAGRLGRLRRWHAGRPHRSEGRAADLGGRSCTRPFPRCPTARSRYPAGWCFATSTGIVGLLASWACSELMHEAFLAGTAPVTTCDGRQPEWPRFEPRPRRRRSSQGASRIGLNGGSMGARFGSPDGEAGHESPRRPAERNP